MYAAAVYEIMGCEKKSILGQRCHQLLYGFLANDHLPRMSSQSHRQITNNAYPDNLLKNLVSLKYGILTQIEKVMNI